MVAQHASHVTKDADTYLLVTQHVWYSTMKLNHISVCCTPQIIQHQKVNHLSIRWHYRVKEHPEAEPYLCRLQQYWQDSTMKLIINISDGYTTITGQRHELNHISALCTTLTGQPHEAEPYLCKLCSMDGTAPWSWNTSLLFAQHGHAGEHYEDEPYLC